jgi:hypothetical protein
MKTILKTALIALALVPMLACSGLVNFAQNIEQLTPSGNIISEERPASGFNAIELRSYGTVLIEQGETEGLVVEGSDNVLARLKTYVSQGRLILKMDPGLTVRIPDELTFRVQLKSLEAVTVSGLGKIQAGSLKTGDFKLVVSGAGELTIQDIQAEDVTIELEGLGNVSLAGEAASLVIMVDGAGNINAGELECQAATVSVEGLGNVTLWVTGELSGQLNGGGSVSYYGNPQTNVESNGVGAWKSLGSK